MCTGSPVGRVQMSSDQKLDYVIRELATVKALTQQVQYQQAQISSLSATDEQLNLRMVDMEDRAAQNEFRIIDFEVRSSRNNWYFLTFRSWKTNRTHRPNSCCLLSRPGKWNCPRMSSARWLFSASTAWVVPGGHGPEWAAVQLWKGLSMPSGRFYRQKSVQHEGGWGRT